jgi:hypothetical protein
MWYIYIIFIYINFYHQFKFKNLYYMYINKYLHNKWGGLVVKEFNSILGVQGSNFTNDIVTVNNGILIEYSIPNSTT